MTGTGSLEQATSLSYEKAAPPCISVADVAKTYKSRRGDVRALDDIDFGIRDGEFLSVVGPSGCGKSTLLRCIAGLAPVSRGTITIRGAVVTGPVANLGIVFQRDLLLDWRTVLGNVLLAIEFRGRRTRHWEDRARTLLDMVGLGDFSNRFPWELSGGMRQRAAICRALLPDPPILLMDEPFGALDALTRDDLNAELQRVWLESRKTVLFITHSISEAVFLSDRVAVMTPKPGQILDIVDIDIARPRQFEVRESAEFAAKSAHIRQMLAKVGALRN